MIVIQHAGFHDLMSREEKRAQVNELGLHPELANHSPLGSVSLTGTNFNRQTILWTIDEESIRGYGLGAGKLAIPSTRIERFLVTSSEADSFSLWIRGTFCFPTRVPHSRGFQQSIDQRPQKSSSSEAVLPAQNMEIGSFFGTVPQRKLVAGLRHLEYRVDECSWDEFFSWSPANG